MVKIKICGITNLEDARLAIEAGADAIGFVFAKSPRRITPENARKIVSQIPPFISTVGVFVDEEQQKVNETIQVARLDTVQFHGSESPAYCSEFRNKVKIIKTFRVKDNKFLEMVPNYEVDAILLDTYRLEQPGGTGEVFDWKLAAKVSQTYPHLKLILAGGLNPENICQAIRVVHPYAVDVSSGVEFSPGKKAPPLVKEFVLCAKRCEV